jgi:hypothetical protein
MMSVCYFVSDILTSGTGFSHKKKQFPLAEHKTYYVQTRSVHYIYSAETQIITHITKHHQELKNEQFLIAEETHRYKSGG